MTLNKQLRILYIEDNPGDQRLMKEMIRESRISNSELFIAGSLTEGAQAISGSSFDLILLDLGLPESKGIATYLTFKDMGIPIPVIVLTGLDDSETALTAVKNGAQDYLIKNQLSTEILEKSILYAIERQALHNEILLKTRQLQESELNLAKAQQVARIGNWTYQVSNQKISWSDQMFNIFDFPRDVSPTFELSQQRAHPDDREFPLEIMKKAIEEKIKDYNYSYRIVLPDGEIRFIEIIAEIVYDQEGAAQVIFGTAQDITERKKTEEALRLVNHKLNILSSITRHDIINSLSALRAYIEFSLDIVDHPELRNFIEKEDEVAVLIGRQIEFTKYYQDVGVHAPTWQNVSDTIQKSARLLKITNIQIQVEMAPIEILADPLLGQVFYNLIENAVRHGESITTIRFTCTEQPPHLSIICEDDGIGVPEDKKMAIFRREYFKHSGFGLYLSREILSITGITITENGTQGTGARFEIVIPKGNYRYISDPPSEK